VARALVGEKRPEEYQEQKKNKKQLAIMIQNKLEIKLFFYSLFATIEQPKGERTWAAWTAGRRACKGLFEARRAFDTVRRGGGIAKGASGTEGTTRLRRNNTKRN